MEALTIERRSTVSQHMEAKPISWTFGLPNPVIANQCLFCQRCNFPEVSVDGLNATRMNEWRNKAFPNSGTQAHLECIIHTSICCVADIAFVDRADIKAYVGPPTLQARYEILRSCLQELLRTGILSNFQDCNDLILPNYASLKGKLNTSMTQNSQAPTDLSKQLLEVAEACEGMSGRSLRKLPFLAHAAFASPYNCDPAKFLCAMVDTARRERSELPE